MAQQQRFELEPEPETSAFWVSTSLPPDESRTDDGLLSATTDREETDEEESSFPIGADALEEKDQNWLAETALHIIQQREWGDWLFADSLFVFGGVTALTGILQFLNRATPAVAGWILGSGVLFALYRYANRYLEMAAALEMTELDTSVVGNLLDSLTSPISRVRGVAMRVLARVLPHLTPKEFAGLTWRRQRRWYRALTRKNHRNYPTFVSASLEALARVGDADSLAVMERLATRRVWNRRGVMLRRTVLQACATLDARLRSPEEMRATPFGEEIAPKRVMQAGVARELERLRQERQTHRQPGMRLGFLVASWAVLVPGASWLAFSAYLSGDKSGIALYSLLALAATQLHRLSLSPQQANSARKLAKQADIHGVGALAEALEWPDSEVRELAGIALTNLLPQLRASDAGLLAAHQRECLHRVLKMRNAGFESPLMLAILNGLEQVGDAAAIPHVERLAASPALTSKQRRVKEAAEQCLPFLRDRADATRGSSMLLRASTPREIVASELLLRPATSVGASEAEELLRAGGGFIDSSRSPTGNKFPR